MKVRVNQDACIGCGPCEQIDDELFHINEEGLSEEVSEDVMDAIVDCVEENDKAYKGHDAEVSGEGKHELTYSVGNAKKGKTKTVVYNFK